MKTAVLKCLNFSVSQCEIILIRRSPLKSSFEFRQSSREDGIVVASSHQEIVHMDSDESNKLSHEHEGTLIQLVLNPSSFCQVTNNSSPPSSWRVPETLHCSVQFQQLLSGLVIHDIKEVEGVRQQDEQEDKRDEEIGDEFNGEVDKVRRDAQHTHET